MSKLVRVAFVPVAVLALAACGGSGSSAGGVSATSVPARGNGGGFDFTTVQTCLKAAGIAVPTPGNGFPTARPSGEARPTDLPRPSGTGGPGGRGGMGQVFQSKEAQAALKACGITIPTGGPRGSAPTTSPTAAP